MSAGNSINTNSNNNGHSLTRDLDTRSVVVWVSQCSHKKLLSTKNIQEIQCMLRAG